MSWVDKYIGTPFVDLGRDFDGVDCYGVMWLIYLHELGIELPTYVGTYICSDEQAEVAKLLGEAGADGPWLESNRAIQPFEVLVFRQGRFNSHLGVAVSRTKMVHVQSADQVKIEDFTQPRWRSRLAGHYRYTGLASGGQL